MIDVENLRKCYGAAIAVDDLSFTVRPGRLTGFLGPNGAGKSTTLRIMLGLDRPDRGTALITGKPFSQIREPIRTVGALLDEATAHPGRTAHHHLLWLAQSNRIGRKRVDEVIDLVGLGSAARRRTGTFSLGMRQRLGLAGALLGDPGVLVLDEPVNGLDPEGIRWIRGLLKQLAAEGRTVLVSSHLMTEMAITADHLIVIGRGRLLADTSMAAFIATHAQSFVRIRTQQVELLRKALAANGIQAQVQPDGLIEIPGVSTAEVGRIAAAEGVVLDELSSHSASLEEAFMQLTEPSADYVSGSAADVADRSETR